MTPKKTSPLGSPITSFHVQPLTWRHFILLFLPGVLVILAFVTYGYWRAIYGYTNYGPVAARTWGQPWFRRATWLTLPLLLYALRRIHRAKYWARVHADGIVVHRPPGRKTILPWEKITGLTSITTKSSFLGWNSDPKHKLTLHIQEGNPIHLDHRYKHLDDLTRLLKKEVYSRLLPSYQTTFQKGQPVNFGSISISTDHLSYQDQQVPWTYVEGITAHNGNLLIRLPAQKEIRVPARQIQNMELLVKLIKEEVRS